MGKRVAHNKLSWEKVLEQFKEVHGDDFDYSNSIYLNTHTKIEIRCKKHDHVFWQISKDHKAGMRCYYCGREAQIEKAKKSKEQFEQEMYNLYGDKYDLSNIEYINTKTDIELECPTHGKFKKKPCDLIKGVSCNKCKLAKSKYNNKTLFIEESFKVFGDITDYSSVPDEISATMKVELICKKHECTFEKGVQTYMAGYGCPQCSAEKYREKRALPKEEYYKRASEANEHKYTYDDDYVTSQYAVTFYCPKHGKQKRNAGEHIRGVGCRHCEGHGQRSDKTTKIGYERVAKGRITYLYLIKCKDENEEFYKIGKTFRKITQRFVSSTLPYNYDVISMHEGDAGYIWDLEEELHEKYKQFSKKPRKYFSGFTECYSTNLPIQEIIELNKNVRICRLIHREV